MYVSVLSCAREWLPENALLKPDKVNQILSYKLVRLPSDAPKYSELITDIL